MLMRRSLLLTFAAAALVLPAASVGHELFDHAPPAGSDVTPPSPAFQAGGENAQWEAVGTIPTGNPHTDLDFFTRAGKTYVSAGTLAAGANAGGQTIFQLADGDNFDPRFVASAPTASCVSSPAAATGLQHDVEATPKGGGSGERKGCSRVLRG